MIKILNVYLFCTSEPLEIFDVFLKCPFYLGRRGSINEVQFIYSECVAAQNNRQQTFDTVRSEYPAECAILLNGHYRNQI